ncbi:hypothetical protein NH8B_1953 [Pseudogulbenkiania sp. NH8B]|uniref:hypothetical protein n=1 Tax=Pseudogulbenkiania sp. (strain NH8B) TaxID=748280 RepID=UPI0002279FEE|nr:hypothetical protein [Pseudogulbenkiania sp. NH8B]BAK76768.1 hypothetical protein NH8B_1953 [Pseudogulbenkiania sp. NH8B]
MEPRTLKALSNAWLHNKLLHIAWHGLPCIEQVASVHRAAEHHGATLEQVHETLEYWWGLLLEPKERKAGLAFLSQRTEHTS